jgi:hypothetical protein
MGTVTYETSPMSVHILCMYVCCEYVSMCVCVCERERWGVTDVQTE